MHTRTQQTSSPSLFTLSKRGQELSRDPPFVTAVTQVWSDLYHPNNNINGYINLGVAENILMADEMCEEIRRVQQEHVIENRHLNYTDFAGDGVFRDALAHMFKKHIFKTDALVNAFDFVVGNGAGSIIEQLGVALCDENEYVMIPAPMYLALTNDFGKRFNTRVLPIHLPYDPSINRFVLNSHVVEQTYKQAIADGKNVRALFLINPDNPTGEVYNQSVVEELIDWCYNNQIHFISDEVYALSIFNPHDHSKNSFVSAGKIMLEKYGRCDFVHIVYSFSKDFTLNGFRIGALYTHNADLMTFFRSCSYFTGISSHTQQVMSHVLMDDEFVSQFIELNAAKMKKQYNDACDILVQNDVTFIHAQAGMFIFIHLAKHIAKWFDKEGSDITTEEEHICWEHILKHAKVNISAGGFFLCSQSPGWFRICFTATGSDIVQLGLNRIFKYLDSTKYNNYN
jgi:aspartate/methionine/tyrosine aminotransferase